MSENPDNKSPAGQAMGAGIAIGAGLGAVLFSITDNPVWIGLGAALGVALGAAWDAKRGS